MSIAQKVEFDVRQPETKHLSVASVVNRSGGHYVKSIERMPEDGLVFYTFNDGSVLAAQMGTKKREAWVYTPLPPPHPSEFDGVEFQLLSKSETRKLKDGASA